MIFYELRQSFISLIFEPTTFTETKRSIFFCIRLVILNIPLKYFRFHLCQILAAYLFRIF